MCMDLHSLITQKKPPHQKTPPHPPKKLQNKTEKNPVNPTPPKKKKPKPNKNPSLPLPFNIKIWVEPGFNAFADFMGTLNSISSWKTGQEDKLRQYLRSWILKEILESKSPCRGDRTGICSHCVQNELKFLSCISRPVTITQWVSLEGRDSWDYVRKETAFPEHRSSVYV